MATSEEPVEVEVWTLDGEVPIRLRAPHDASLGWFIAMITSRTQESQERLRCAHVILLGTEEAAEYSLEHPFTRIMMTGPVRRAREANVGRPVTFQLVFRRPTESA